jgi:hypothetical protein
VAVVAAAVVPSAPLLVPQVAAGAAPELAHLRAACDTAVGRVLAHPVDAVVVLGSGPPRSYPHGSAGSFDGFGVPVRVALGDDLGESSVLPLPLCVGAWLLTRSRCAVVTAGVTVDGAGWSSPAVDVGVLVVADGSACRSEKAPGAFDPRAEAFDGTVAAALAAADGSALVGLDAGLAAQLSCSGVPALQALGALDGPWSGELLYDEAPYGVGYFVATWERS